MSNSGGDQRFDGDADWNGWKQGPETSEFGPVTWQSAGPAGSGDWHHHAAGDQGWPGPAENTRSTRRLPVILISVAGVLAIAIVGVVAWGLADRRGEPELVEAWATTSPGTSAPAASTTPSATDPVTTTVAPAPVRAASSRCTNTEIARDIGRGPIDFVDCFGDWAVVRWAQGSGDGGVVRLVDGVWTTTRFGPSSCVQDEYMGVVPGALYSQYLIPCGSPDTRPSRSRPSDAYRASATPGREAPNRPPVAVPAPERTADAPPRAPEPPPPPPPPPAPPEDSGPEPDPEPDPVEPSEPAGQDDGAAVSGPTGQGVADAVG